MLKRSKRNKPTTQIAGILGISRIKQINTSVIWDDIKHDKTIQLYLPDIFIKIKRVPNRNYMFMVSLKGIYSTFTRYIQEDASPNCQFKRIRAYKREKI